MSELTIGVAIATHNRLNDLKRTLEALTHLNPVPDGIWICVDGCSDGTEAFLHGEYPQLHVIINELPQGSIPARNALAASCSCDVMLSLDDDSYPLEPDFIARLRSLFSTSPRLAVATFPQRSDEFPDSFGALSFGPPTYVASYVNSGAAIRLAVFHALGGYPGFFFHAYEEPDFALRCFAAGWQVRYETSITIRHHYSITQRNELRTHHRHARNELWSVCLRCPFPMLIPVALFRVARQFHYALQRGANWAIREPDWWLACIRGLRHCWKDRLPVSWRSYWCWMRLMRRPLESEQEWCALAGSGSNSTAVSATAPVGRLLE